MVEYDEGFARRTIVPEIGKYYTCVFFEFKYSSQIHPAYHSSFEVQGRGPVDSTWPQWPHILGPIPRQSQPASFPPRPLVVTPNPFISPNASEFCCTVACAVPWAQRSVKKLAAASPARSSWLLPILLGGAGRISSRPIFQLFNPHIKLRTACANGTRVYRLSMHTTY